MYIKHINRIEDVITDSRESRVSLFRILYSDWLVVTTIIRVFKFYVNVFKISYKGHLHE